MSSSESDDSFLVDSDSDVEVSKKKSVDLKKKALTKNTPKPKPAEKITKKATVKAVSSKATTELFDQRSAITSVQISKPVTQSSSTTIQSINSGISDDITRGPPVATEAAAKKLISAYMTQQNRPYSAIQIFDNLHARVPKNTVQRILDVLSSSGGGLRMKEYGKAKIYFLDQSTLPSEPSASEIRTLDDNVMSARKNLLALQAEEKILKESLSNLLAQPTDDHLDSAIFDTEAKLKQNKGRLLKISGTPVDPMALEIAVASYNAYRKVWVDRKRKCIDIVNMIADGNGKRRADVISEMGLETDEDVNVVIPNEIQVATTSRR